MKDSKNLEKEREQQLRLKCIDYATRLEGKIVYADDLIKAAEQLYEFVTK